MGEREREGGGDRVREVWREGVRGIERGIELESERGMERV